MVSKKVSVSVSEKFGIEKSIGIGFENFWYRKKYRYRFRKILVSKKVSDSVSKIFGIRKKFRFRFRSDFWFRHSLDSDSPQIIMIKVKADIMVMIIVAMMNKVIKDDHIDGDKNANNLPE